VIPSNTEVVVTGLLMFESREEIPKVATIRLAKNIDPDTANFEINLVNAVVIAPTSVVVAVKAVTANHGCRKKY
jgi:hypothetical protein